MCHYYLDILYKQNVPRNLVYFYGTCYIYIFTIKMDSMVLIKDCEQLIICPRSRDVIYKLIISAANSSARGKYFTIF